MIAEFELGLAADVAALARVLDDAGDAVDGHRTLVRVARLAVTTTRRLSCPRPVVVVVRVVVATLPCISPVVVAHLSADEAACQKAGANDRQQNRVLHRVSLTVIDSPLTSCPQPQTLVQWLSISTGPHGGSREGVTRVTSNPLARQPISCFYYACALSYFDVVLCPSSSQIPLCSLARVPKVTPSKKS